MSIFVDAFQLNKLKISLLKTTIIDACAHKTGRIIVDIAKSNVSKKKTPTLCRHFNSAIDWYLYEKVILKERMMLVAEIFRKWQIAYLYAIIN